MDESLEGCELQKGRAQKTSYLGAENTAGVRRQLVRVSARLWPCYKPLPPPLWNGLHSAHRRFQEDVMGTENVHLHVCLGKPVKLPTIPTSGDIKPCYPKSASKPSQGWK